MIEIYHAPRTRSCRVIWLCEEMGLAYETLAFSAASPEIAVLNPALTVPILRDGEVVLTESVTMLDYIAQTYGPTDLALSPDHPAYWTYRQFLMFGEASLAAPVAAVIPTALRAPDDQKDNWTVRLLKERFVRRLEVVSNQLKASPFMAGDAFSLADISVVYMINQALINEAFGLKDLVPADIVAYRDRLAARPAFQKAYAD